MPSRRIVVPIFNTKAICVVDPDSLGVLNEGQGIKIAIFDPKRFFSWTRIHLKLKCWICWIRIRIRIN
jgi:hypothetical protein